MSTDKLDYSNTIIYKIYCNDNSISDVYVGHTTNFTNRKTQHKLSCNNLNNKFKLYDTIRQNGGWNNWNMVEIAEYNCKDKTEARIKEQQHYEELKATLNSCPPCVDKKNYFCITCNKQCNGPKPYETHINSNIHKKGLLPYNENDKTNKCLFFCDICNYKTSRKSQYDRHLLTSKHNNLTSSNNLTNQEQNDKNKLFTCKNCDKEYKGRDGLWRHNKKCTDNFKTPNPNIEYVNTIIYNNKKDKDIMKMLIKDNNEFKNMLIEQQTIIINLINKLHS